MVSRAALREQPYLVWNAFIDLVALTEQDDLTPVQSVAHLAFWYDSELQNGGHLQHFSNRGAVCAAGTIGALTVLAAKKQSAILMGALGAWQAQGRTPIASVEDYIEEALADEFGDYVARYHQCVPALTSLLQAYLDANESQFIDYPN